MPQFIERIKPVLVLGGIILFIFFVVIFLGLRKNSEGPELVFTTEELTTSREEVPEIFVPRSAQTISNAKAPVPVKNIIDTEEEAEEAQKEFLDTFTTDDPAEIDSTYGVQVIEYTTNGFEPRNAMVAQHQLVIWVNNTDQTIALTQTTPRYDEWKQDRVLPPGETTEFRFTGLNNWTYMEANSQAFGSVFTKRSYKNGYFNEDLFESPETPEETP